MSSLGSLCNGRVFYYSHFTVSLYFIQSSNGDALGYHSEEQQRIQKEWVGKLVMQNAVPFILIFILVLLVFVIE